MSAASSTDAAPEPRRLRSDVFLMFATKAGGIVLNVVTSAIVARALGVSGRGIVAVALNFTRLLVQFGTLGMTNANPYFAAKDRDARARLASNSIALALVAGIALVGIGLLLRATTPSVVKGLDWTETSLALASVPVMLAVLFLHSILLGEGRTVAYNLTELILSVAIAVGLFIVLVPLNGGVRAAIGFTAATQAISALVYLIVLRNGEGFRLPPPDFELLRRMFRYAARVYVATLLGYAVIRIDLLLVNGYLGARQAGLYAAAVALADGVYLIPTVIATNIFARVARGMGSDSSAVVFRNVAVLYGGLVAVTAPLAGIAIRVVYGSRFSDATHLYWWLAPGVFALGMITILSQYFAGRGFPMAAVLVWFPALALDIAINIMFLSKHGTYIASLASSISYGFLLLLHMQLFARDTGGWRSMVPRPREVVQFVRAALSPER